MQNGQPAFDLINLKRLSITFTEFEDERNIRYLLQNAKFLQQLRLSANRTRSVVGVLSESLSARTLKILDIVFLLFSDPLLSGLCKELEAMAGHNVLEALSFEVRDADGLGTKLQELENVRSNLGGLR